MKKEIKDFKESNKGFSLVELIVAVSILVLVSIPFALAFITATKVNGAARNKERANTAATTEMEYLRATDFSLLTQQADVAGASGAQVTLSKSYSSTGTSSPDIEGTLIKGNRRNPSANINMDSYTYMRDVTIDGKPFHIQATMDPFSASGAGTAAGSNETAFYNNDVQKSFPILTTSTDITNANSATFTLTNEKNEEMASKLADYYFQDSSYTELYEKSGASGSSGNTYRRNKETAKVIPDMKRAIWFKIKNEPKGGGNFETTVSVNAQFFYTKNVGKGLATYPVDLGYKVIYNSMYNASGAGTASNSNLKNIYFNYYPNFNSRSIDPLDNIYIINDPDNPVDVKFHILPKDLRSTTNTYGIGIYAANSVAQGHLSSITMANIKNNPNIKTTVYLASNVNTRCRYTEDISGERGYPLSDYLNTSYSSLLCSNLINLSAPKNNTASNADGNSPIYVVKMSVYSGDRADESKKLIELDSTVQ